MNSVFSFSIIIAGSVLLSACTAVKPMNSTKNHPPNKVIAHRGAFKNTGVPQNSIASLQEAIKLGCGGSEFDIHMTSDEVIVINHDHDFLGVPIETSTYATLLQKTLPNGEKIPTLENYLKTGVQQHYTKLIAEIKASRISKERSLKLTQKVVEMVKQWKAENWVTYISFDYDVCKKIKQLDPKAPVQYLNGDASAEKLRADGLDADYHFSVFQRDKNWIANAKKVGIIVNAWTVNDPAVMDEFLAQGIDLITTDEPEILLKKLKK